MVTKLENMPVELLPISSDYIALEETLPFIHRDPFDRMIVATAIAENMTILTADSNISKYDVSCVW